LKLSEPENICFVLISPFKILQFFYSTCNEEESRKLEVLPTTVSPHLQDCLCELSMEWKGGCSCVVYLIFTFKCKTASATRQLSLLSYGILQWLTMIPISHSHSWVLCTCFVLWVFCFALSEIQSFGL